jgi:DNA-binding Xre family transcriptional regulator
MTVINKKLTDQDVIEIMKDYTSKSQELADRYGISESHVRNIQCGLKRKNISQNPEYARTIIRKRNFAKKLSDPAVIDIMTDKVSSAQQLADKYGINVSQIYHIHAGHLWKHISCDPQYTRRNFKNESRKLNIDIVTKIKNNEVTDYNAVAKEYNVTAKHLKRLRNKNYYEAWKTIPIKD